MRGITLTKGDEREHRYFLSRVDWRPILEYRAAGTRTAETEAKAGTPAAAKAPTQTLKKQIYQESQLA
jgi:hypothetical protein